mmetsp:Transcript_136970/g.324484  ORF Transcript_136970/g.324484 Transcript_136970/m.324484 type:complete len:223 (+) Transcript_136970:455-1123(+)
MLEASQHLNLGANQIGRSCNFVFAHLSADVLLARESASTPVALAHHSAGMKFETTVELLQTLRSRMYSAKISQECLRCMSIPQKTQSVCHQLCQLWNTHRIARAIKAMSRKKSSPPALMAPKRPALVVLDLSSCAAQELDGGIQIQKLLPANGWSRMQSCEELLAGCLHGPELAEHTIECQETGILLLPISEELIRGCLCGCPSRRKLSGSSLLAEEFLGRT